MTTLKKKLPGAIQFALFASAVSLTAGNAMAQDADTSDTGTKATTLDKVEVTGSRLKRAQIEGATPVMVLDRAAIDASGNISVAEMLRDSTFASFGNFKPQSGSSAQSLATIDLRGLGSGRTLVLIDGRRAPTNPMSASSGTDLNTIPMAAVERIEILTDGASAVYGSDAIGGVMNIIMRKDFDGVELRYGSGNPAIKGGDTEELSVTMGVTSDRGSLLGSASKNSRGMVFTRDQIGGNVLGVSSYGNNYRVTGSGAAWVSVPGFDCTQGAFWENTAANQCSFDFNSVAAQEASVDTKSVFLKGDYAINDDWKFFSTAMIAKTETFGRYAPVPGEINVDDNTPNDIIKGDGLGTSYRHRFAAAGNRDNFTDATNLDLTAGVNGQITDRISGEFGLRWTDYKFVELGRGYIVSAIAEQMANSGDYMLTDPYGADPSVLNAIQATINRESRFSSDQWFASLTFDLFEMGGGISNAVIGVEGQQQEYFDKYDSLSEAGQVLGSAGNSSAGNRDIYSAYFEWLFPFSSTFDVTVAGRFDDYSDYGSDFSPKVSARWQALDNLTFRASYGEGFRAPGLDILTQSKSFSAEPVNDPQSCIAAGQAATCQLQVDSYSIANPDLGSEQSKQYSLGVVYDPTDWLNFSVDYWNIELSDTISSVSAQDIIDRDLDPGTYGPIPAGLSITRNANTGSIEEIIWGYANLAQLNTDGVDFRMGTRFDFGGAGTMRNNLTVSWINSYEETSETGVKTEYIDLNGYPEYRANLANTWTFGDFSFDWNINYIAGQNDAVGGYATNDVQASWNTPWNGSLSIGATNLGDRYPELVAYDGRPWNFYLYDAYGRTIYFRITQKF